MICNICHVSGDNWKKCTVCGITFCSHYKCIESRFGIKNSSSNICPNCNSQDTLKRV